MNKFIGLVDTDLATHFLPFIVIKHKDYGKLSGLLKDNLGKTQPYRQERPGGAGE